VTERRAQQERDLSARLDKEDRWRRGRLRDVVSASELTHEWGSQVTRATIARGTTIGQMVREDRERMWAFAEGMPSSRVAISLKTRYHRDEAGRVLTYILVTCLIRAEMVFKCSKLL